MSHEILIVEDEFLVAHELETSIQEGGWRVAGAAHTCAHALQLLSSTDCDVVLLDISLANGELSTPVAELLVQRRTPFIVISGYDQSQFPEPFLGAPVLPKPFTPDAVKTLIRTIIAGLPDKN